MILLLVAEFTSLKKFDLCKLTLDINKECL